ncbi:MAG: site-2 protease family protein [Clostridiaceae bacterium]
MFGNFNLMTTIYTIPGILLAFTFHEYAHAYVADKLGDNTPRFQGRLTLNPLVHIDIMGFIMIIIFHFGWAKPVETNPRNFKHYYKDDLLVSIAGVIGNLIVALISAIVLGILIKISPMITSEFLYTIMGIVYKLVYYTIYINCILAIFNLLPVPGLDGFHILRDLFPKTIEPLYYKVQRYQIFIILIVVYFAGYIISTPAILLFSLFLKIANII